VNQDIGAADPLYPGLEPFDSNVLPVGGGHRVYYEQSGRRDGFPALFLHGGPGSHSRAQHRRYFDPAHYRIVLFDQRGCGQSAPRGETANNTTAHLVADIECLRKALGIERWLLFGGSWGSALALAYAATHPDAVAGLVLRGVFLGGRMELDWYLKGVRAFIPEAVERLQAGASRDLVRYYHAQVNHPDRSRALAAASRWSAFEEQVMAIGSPAAAGAPNSAPTGDDDALLARARIQLHYLAAECFLRENELLDGAWRVRAHTIIVQGRLDMVCPPVTAHALSRRLPSCELRIVEQGGHSGMQPLIAGALRQAADDMRGIVTAT
jgi:proline iminopeptidase